jgi:hypothetical protein
MRNGRTARRYRQAEIAKEHDNVDVLHEKMGAALRDFYAENTGIAPVRPKKITGHRDKEHFMEFLCVSPHTPPPKFK